MSVVFSKGWERVKRALSRRRFRRLVMTAQEREVSNQLNLLRADIVRYIDAERHGVPNSPLTVLTKGSSRPLVDRGDLRESVNVRGPKLVAGVITGGVGVLRGRRTRKGKSVANVAIILHEGAVIKVTPKVRAAVFAELRRRAGGRRPRPVAAGSDRGASRWVIKPRPFVKDPFKAAEPRIKEALGDAVEISVKRL